MIIGSFANLKVINLTLTDVDCFAEMTDSQVEIQGASINSTFGWSSILQFYSTAFQIHDTVFYGGFTQRGGALDVQNQQLKDFTKLQIIDNTTFYNNFAKHFGGSIQYTGQGL
jgi:hypothetical protein